MTTITRPRKKTAENAAPREFRATATMRVLAAAVQANVPTLLWGSPGIGKTSIIEDAAKSWGRHCEAIAGGNREATDFLGVMVETEGDVWYATFRWVRRLVEAPRGLLFLDELSTASPSTQKGMLRVLQERVVGETAMPDTVSIVAAANPPEEAVDGWDLPGPIANRLLHLDWDFDADVWQTGVASGFRRSTVPPVTDLIGHPDEARRARVVGLVTAFLRAMPQHLNPKMPTDPVQAGRAWASPRSWTNAIEVLAQLYPDDAAARLVALSGLVGEGPATEFLSWEALQDVHDPEDAIDHPENVDWDAPVDRMFALGQSMMALAIGRDDPEFYVRTMHALSVGARHGLPDVMMPAVQGVANAMPRKGFSLTAETVDAFSDLFQRMGLFAEAG